MVNHIIIESPFSFYLTLTLTLYIGNHLNCISFAIIQQVICHIFRLNSYFISNGFVFNRAHKIATKKILYTINNSTTICNCVMQLILQISAKVQTFGRITKKKHEKLQPNECIQCTHIIIVHTFMSVQIFVYVIMTLFLLVLCFFSPSFLMTASLLIHS